MTTHSEPSVNVILLLSSSHSRIWSLIVGGMMGVWKRTRKSKNMKTTGSVQTYPFLFENGYIRFVPVWRTVHRYPMKTVTENASFQKLSPERRSLKTGFAVLVWIRRFLKTITSQCWISVCGSFLRRWC